MAYSDREKRLILRALMYGAAALFLALFAMIYERFSHGVWSYYMVFSCVAPLGLGTLPCLAMALWGGRMSLKYAPVWRCGVATLAVGSVARGILEIYGTAHPAWAAYPIVGAALCAAAVGLTMGRR